MTRKPRRIFTDEFKKQMVDLVNTGKKKADIVREYELHPSALNRWVNQSNNTGSFKEKDNRTNEENEVLKLKKELEYLKMENDILKQAAHKFCKAKPPTVPISLGNY